MNGVSLANVARLSSDGSVDGAFAGSGANIGGSVTSMALQIDGKILISDSAFTAVNGVARRRFARLNSDGSLDSAFTVTADNPAQAWAIQPDGKILIGGFFATINGVGRASVARLNSDGSLDTTFNPGTDATGGGVSAIALQSDGKIIIGGFFTSINGTARNKIARLNSDGSLDTAFTASVTGTNAQVSSLTLQSDGKILLGGFFSTVNTVSRSNCARLNSDGTLETIFNPPTSLNGGVNAMAIQADGKIVIGGNFVISSGQGRDRIARLNNDGSFDSAFNAGTNPNGVNAVALQLDGKILVGGDYTLINGVTGNRVTRLNADGTTDATFNIGTGANKVVRALALQADGKILVGGSFSSINGIGRTGIARLFADGAAATPTPTATPSPTPVGSPTPLACASPVTSTFTNTASIAINDSSLPPTKASLYPSTITVANVTGAVSKVTVKLNNLSHAFPNDIDIMLVAPTGQNMILMSDVGGASPVSGITLTLDDAASSTIPSPLTTGRFRPTNAGATDGFPSPAPQSSGEASFSRFIGMNPNGDWNLYIVDDTEDDAGTLVGGWELSITTCPAPAATPTPTPACITNPVVTNSNDSGAGSLRQAISDACPNSTITFSSNSFTITLQSELVIDKSLTIQGGNTNLFVTLNGNNASRVLNLTNSAATVTLSGLSIRNGKSNQGGGIRSTGTLNLINTFVGLNSTVTDNVGGGVYVASGSLNLSAQSGINGNTGGGVFLCGSVCGAGNSSSATITNGLVSNNSTSGSASAGGGITLGTQGTLTIVNSTISGNTSAGDGGGILNGGGSVTLINSTVSNNTANSGGGISNSGSASLRNTIVAGNNGPTAPDVAGTYASPQFNLIGKSDGSSGFSNGTNGNIVGSISAPVDPKLGPFSNNGCSGCITTTHALLSGSPAINAGNNALAVDSNGIPLTGDQRGSGFPRIANGTVDIGAFEVQGATPTPTPTPTPTTVQFDSSVYLVNEVDGHVNVNVTRTGDTSGAATVDYRTTDTDTFTVNCATKQGQAYGRCDFATVVGTFSFAAGESSKTFAVPIIDDSYAEGVETFSVVLSNPNGASLGATSSATVSITDNDSVDGPNPILRSDNAAIDFFVRQHYLDFLGREPEPGQPWSNVLRNCSDQFNTNPGSPAAGCDRITVSGAFFGSPEFKDKGIYVIDFYRVAFNRLPTYVEFSTDLASITGATAAETFAKRAAYASGFVQRSEFANIYGAMSNTTVVNTLMSGGQGQAYNLASVTTRDPANPDLGNKITLTTTDLINQLTVGTLTRGQALRAIVQSDEIAQNKEAVNAFVASQYYGYLRRTPDTGGFNGWKTYLQDNPNDFRTMVHGFLNSTEYRLRFGPVQ